MAVRGRGRRWVRLYEEIWIWIRNLSDQPRLAYLYCYGSAHGNLLGCFSLPIPYMSHDLQWPEEECNEALRDLEKARLIHFDERNEWIFVVDFLRWNAIENPKQAIAAARLLESVPEESSVFPLLLAALKPYKQHFDEGFLEGLDKREAERLRNPD